MKVKSSTGIKAERKHVREAANEEQRVLTIPAKPQTEVRQRGEGERGRWDEGVRRGRGVEVRGQ